MKKSILSLSGVAVLSNEEQKIVKGGSTASCATITYTMVNGRQYQTREYGLNYAEASTSGASHWCCASCLTSSWYSD